MNTFGKDLYNQLMALCAERDLFYFQDRILDDCVYRVFSYHMGSYTDFCQPSALECRGVMFKMDGENAIELVSLPFQKFFNLHENPFTMTPDYSKVTHFEEKADGSLISTYIHNGELKLKSKTSLASIMAQDAMEYLNEPEQYKFKLALAYLAANGFTTIMEWCDPKPESRIVLFYETRQLRVFGIRSTETGEIMDYVGKTSDQLLAMGLVKDRLLQTHAHIFEIGRYSVKRYFPENPEEFASNVPSEAGIEGYIMVGTDQRIKIKTQWYITQHRLKDSVTNEKALFCAVIAGSSDDLKSVFWDNPGAIEVITEMEEFAEPVYQQFVHNVERYYEFNKHLDRKEYAVQGQVELTRQEFGCAMAKYLKRDVDYSAILIKNATMYVDQYKGQVVTGEKE